MNKFTLCVYCASSALVNQTYFDATKRLAASLVQGQVSVVYGGGGIGLMGALADTIIELGGSIKGIMPQFMNDVKWAHRLVQDFEFTQTLHERKAKFLENIDGLVALPGGSGTLEELLEAITLKRLGLFTKPIVILNTNGFYNPLREMLDRCISEKFMDRRHSQMWEFVDQPEQVLDAILRAPSWDQDAIQFATNR